MHYSAFRFASKICVNFFVVLSLFLSQFSPSVQAKYQEPSAPPDIQNKELSNIIQNSLSPSNLFSSSFQIKKSYPKVTADKSSNSCLDDYCVYLPLAVKSGTPISLNGPDLAVTISDNNVSANPGDTVVYVLSYLNNGSKDSTGISLSGILPVNTSFDSSSSTTGWKQIGTSRLYSLTIGSLSAGQSGQVTFAITIPDPAPQDLTEIQIKASIQDDGTHGGDPNTSNNSASESTPVNSPSNQVDLTVSVSDGGQPAVPGGKITYELEYTNIGSSPASGVVLTEFLPDFTHFDASVSTSGWQQVGTTHEYTFAIGDLASGSNGTATFVVAVTDTVTAGVAAISNTASIVDDGLNGNDANAANNTTSSITILEAQPDLKISMDDHDQPVLPGATLVYELSYSNVGNQNATGVLITETLPQHTSYDVIHSSPGWQKVGATNQYQLMIGGFGAGINGSVQFAVIVTSEPPQGVTSISNTATITDDGANGTDPTNSNNTVNTITPLTLTLDLPDLAVTQQADITIAVPGDTIVYTIQYLNSGTEPASGSILTSTLPANTTFNALESNAGWQQIGSTNQYTYAIGNIAEGGSGSSVFVVDVIGAIPAGAAEISHITTISDDGSHGVDKNAANNTSTLSLSLSAQPDLTLAVIDGGQAVVPGDTLTYLINYQNNGNQGATGVALSATLPENTSFDAVKSTAGWQQVGTGSQYRLMIGGLNSAVSGTASFTVDVASSVPAGLSTLSGSFSIFDDGLNGSDPTPVNNSTSTATAIDATPDLSLTKSDGGLTSVIPGATLTYTLTYANVGNQGATGVILIENLPEYTAFDAVHSAASWQQVGTSTQYQYAVGSLGAGGSGSTQFAVTVTGTPPTGVVSVTNSAVISDNGANGLDLVSTNNTATRTTALNLSPDLGLTKSGTALVQSGSVIEYTLSYSNQGYANATGVVVTETVPANTTFNVASSSVGWLQVGSTSQYQYTVGNVDHNASGQIVFVVTADASLPASITGISNTASIADDGTNGTDQNSLNNTATYTSLVSSGPTNICGAISTNTIWTADKSPYIVTCDVTINSGVTLTIEPGTIIKFNATSRRLVINGTVNASGTEANRVYFTSYKDDSLGGDTNGDGNTTSPQRGDWSTLYVGDTGQLNLVWTVVRYGGYSSSYYANVYLTGNAIASIDNSIISHSSYYGVRVNTTTSGKNTQLTIHSSTIENNTNKGIYVYITSATGLVNISSTQIRQNGSTGFETNSATGLTFQNNNILDNQGYAGYISFSSNSYQLLAGNSGSGNTKNGIALAGTIGQNTSLSYMPTMAYIIPSNDLTVNAGATLTIPAGQGIKGDSTSSRLTVNGTLLTQGTSGAPVYFTSIKDDSVGGDDNKDGTASTPASGDWSGIYVQDGGLLEFNYTHLRYGGYGTDTNASSLALYRNAQATLNNSSISYSRNDGIHLSNNLSTDLNKLFLTNSIIQNNYFGVYTSSNYGSFQVTISGSTIRNNQEYGVYIDASNTTTISNSEFSGNGNTGLYLSRANQVSLNNNTFTNNAGYAAYAAYLYFQNGTYSSLAGNSGSGNTINGIALAGTIGQNTILSYMPTMAYIIPSNDLTVNAGATLTIPAGQGIKGDSTSSRLTVNGTLLTQGTSGAPVYFTSIKDDSVGGDDNKDGTASTPASGDWSGIYVQDGGLLEFNYTHLRYGGYGTDTNASSLALYRNAQATLNNSSISYSRNDGIHLSNNLSTDLNKLFLTNSIIQNNYFGVYTSSNYGSFQVTISGSTIRNNQEYGVYIDASNTTTISNSEFSGNGNTGLYLSRANQVSLNNNTFTNNAGYAAYAAYLYFQNGTYSSLAGNSGSGNTINGIALAGTIGQNTILSYMPTMAYIIPSNDLTVNAGATLTIPAGQGIKAESTSSHLRVNGTLLSQGTSSTPVYFTSIKDDSVGGDDNKDGTASTPAPGDWASISVATTGRLILNYTHLRYGGNISSSNGSIDLVNNAQGTLNNSSVSYSAEPGIYLNTGSASYTVNLTLTSSTLQNNSDHGIYYSWSGGGTGLINITGSTFRNNTGNGIRLEQTGTVYVFDSYIYNNFAYGIYNGSSSSVVTARNNWWGSSSGPAPFGSGNGINYRTCYDSVLKKNYICQYYVDASPWLGQTVSYGKAAPYQKRVSDPVNTATGNFSYNRTDLSISTRSLPIQFSRAYNSAYPEDGVMGLGWTHSYNIKAVESTIDQSVTISFGDGHTERFTWNGTSYVPPAGVYSILARNNGLFHLTFKNQTLYSFDSLGRLAYITDRNGNITTLTYTGANISQVTAPDGRTLAFTYNGSGRLSQITDPLARTVQYSYDAAGNLTTVTDLNNQPTTFAYDTNHRLLSITDANNHTFVINVYNDDGRVIEQYDAQNHKTTFDYDIINHLTTVTDALNHTTTYQYDADLRLTGETDGLTHTESYTYDINNNRLTVADRNNHTTIYTYDSNGNVLTVTNARNGVSTYTYDDHNNVLTFTDPLSHMTTYTYDASGNRLSATDALISTTTYTYYEDADRLGLLHTVTDPLSHTTTYDYNSQGDLTSVIDPLNQTQTYTYDLGGRKLTYTDARSNTWTYAYDNLNRLLSETDPRSGVTTYTYDPVGNLNAQEDPNHKSTIYIYDEKDLLTTVTDTQKYVSSFTYDAVGNKLTETDGNLHTTTYGYDAANRLVTVTNSLNQMISYGYDNAGNRTTVTDALSHTTSTAYDELNRPVTITDPLNHVATTTYDAVGNVLTITDANNHTTSYTYTAANQLQTVTDARNGVVTYGYDAVGNRISMEDANHHITSYTYNENNLLVSVTDPLNHASTHTYDANGNRATTLDANGHTTTYTYDELNRLTHIVYDDGTSVAYTYDAAGNRLTMVDSLGTTSYVYDDLYRPLSISNPTGSTSYTYDALNRLTITTPAGTTNYTYDAADRMQTVTDWQNQVTTYTYDAADRQTGIAYPNGVTTTNTYDNADRLTSIITVNGATTLASITYTMDNVGNRLTMVDSDGVTTYTYDELNRLLTVAYPTGSPASVSYTYDPMGNRLTMTEDGVMTTYAYNEADQLTSTTRNSVTTTYTWDNNGNMLTKGSQTFTWNHAGRMVELTNAGTTASYRYNGDGVRLGKTVNGIVTDYLQDQAAGLPVVVRETASGTISEYVYGTDMLAMSSGGWLFFHTDGLGSTRAITNPGGTVTERYSYDAFGGERSHMGSSTQPFTYTGEQVDPEAGFIFLRARYYDPMGGRFINRDQFKGVMASIQTLNRYLYTINNPIKANDPSGMFIEETSDKINGFMWEHIVSNIPFMKDMEKLSNYGDQYASARARKEALIFEATYGDVTSEEYEQVEREEMQALNGMLKTPVDIMRKTPGTSLNISLDPDYFKPEIPVPEPVNSAIQGKKIYDTLYSFYEDPSKIFTYGLNRLAQEAWGGFMDAVWGIPGRSLDQQFAPYLQNGSVLGTSDYGFSGPPSQEK